jgi:hypothetical protein
VIVIVAIIGNRDDKGDQVSAGDWAQNVCGPVGVWRGELEAIVEQIRTPEAVGTLGVAEPQSETPQTRTGLVREGLDRAVRATDTMVKGVDNAGVPDTAQGEQAAGKISDWADGAKSDLEKAQDSLDQEADSLETSVQQLTTAVGAIASTAASGKKTVLDIVQLDPALAGALRDSSTCQKLREETNA